jgi:hypothetical protein
MLTKQTQSKNGTRCSIEGWNEYFSLLSRSRVLTSTTMKHYDAPENPSKAADFPSPLPSDLKPIMQHSHTPVLPSSNNTVSKKLGSAAEVKGRSRTRHTPLNPERKSHTLVINLTTTFIRPSCTHQPPRPSPSTCSVSLIGHCRSPAGLLCLEQETLD